MTEPQQTNQTDPFHELIKQVLQINQLIKNYKYLCALLNEQPKTGKSKTLQENNWKRYFDWIKDGHKYIITAIHETPIPKTENTDIYSKYIEKLILDLLVQKYQSKNNSRRLYLSKDNMLQALSMVNLNYHFVKFNTGKTSDYIKVNHDNLKEFFNLNNKNLIDSIDRALNRLSNKFLVIWQLVYTIALKEEVIIIDEFGKKIKLKENHITAEPLELEYINTYENIIAQEMECETKQEIYLSGKYLKFINNVCERIQEDIGLNILYYYQSYDIIFHPNVIKERDKINQYLLAYEERQNVKITLNGIISKQLYKNAENRQLEAKSKLIPWWGTRGIEHMSFEERRNARRANVNYLDETNKIIDTVINIEKEDLKNKIENYTHIKKTVKNNQKEKSKK